LFSTFACFFSWIFLIIISSPICNLLESVQVVVRCAILAAAMLAVPGEEVGLLAAAWAEHHQRRWQSQLPFHIALIWPQRGHSQACGAFGGFSGFSFMMPIRSCWLSRFGFGSWSLDMAASPSSKDLLN
jgi:hypothetical protein